jgi:hypothetical protein
MNLDESAAAPVWIKIDGKDVELRLFSVRDLVRLKSLIPDIESKDRPFISVWDLARWSETPDGAVAILSESSGYSHEQVSAWDVVANLVSVARTIMYRSLISDSEPPKVTDEKPGDGQKKSNPRLAS